MTTSIYLDHHATTPCDPRVVTAMLPCFAGAFGNASSQHAYGRSAAGLVERARGQVARLLGCESAEVVFTSGASESNNLALKGIAEAYAHRGRHLITAVTEHRAVLDVCGRLESRGFDVTYLKVDAEGRVSPQAVAQALRDETILVSLMLANNEIGVLHPIREIAEMCRERGVLVHTDAAQALAWIDCDVARLGVDLMSISGHKAYGPKGVGALYLRRRKPRVRLVPRIEGGGHERGRRSGTLNVPGIVGLGAACELVAAERRQDSEKVGRLRDLLLRRLRQSHPGLAVHGSLEHRLPNNLNVSFPDVDAERLLGELSTVAVSAGSACSSPGSDGSYVLKTLPDAGDAAGRSIRFGLGRSTTEMEIANAAAEVADAVAFLRPKPFAANRAPSDCLPPTCLPTDCLPPTCVPPHCVPSGLLE